MMKWAEGGGGHKEQEVSECEQGFSIHSDNCPHTECRAYKGQMAHTAGGSQHTMPGWSE